MSWSWRKHQHAGMTSGCSNRDACQSKHQQVLLVDRQFSSSQIWLPAQRSDIHGYAAAAALPTAVHLRRVGAKQSRVLDEQNAGGSTTLHERNGAHPLANTAEGRAPHGLHAGNGGISKSPGAQHILDCMYCLHLYVHLHVNIRVHARASMHMPRAYVESVLAVPAHIGG
eukprot:1148597-Pelagomonas_calceolata.AAC.17